MNAPHLTRRQLIGGASIVGALALGAGALVTTLRSNKIRPSPRVTFYGATQQVSGSCHILETSSGLFLIDCGTFSDEGENPQSQNKEFPFEPRDVKAVFLTHAHTDHNGRLPLLYARGFRGAIYCTESTRDLSKIMLEMVAGLAEDNPSTSPLYGKSEVAATLNAIKVVPYEVKIEELGIAFRFTEAGHILGSAMIEIWADEKKILFGGDMGNDAMPLLPKPKQHEEADLVLVESTYGATARDVIRYEDFGHTIMKVVHRGGSVLLPAFVLHKTQALIYIINKLKADGIIDPRVPVYADSSTGKAITSVYDKSRRYLGSEAQAIKAPFYRTNYIELSGKRALATHGQDPAIYISSSGNLDHASAPKHLHLLANDPKNAVLFVGWQSPKSVGNKLLAGEKVVLIPWEEYGANGVSRVTRQTNIKLQVAKWGSGFSSHARGQQILEWLQQFHHVGAVAVVHGEADKAKALAAKIKEMNLEAFAPQKDVVFKVTSNPQRPSAVPSLEDIPATAGALTDQ